MVTGGDDSDTGRAGVRDAVALVDEGLVATYLARTPVGCDGLPLCVFGAWSVALTTSGSERTEVRGRFSIMALISGCCDNVLVEGEVRATVVVGGVRAAFFTNAARCPSGDGSERPLVETAMVVGANPVAIVS